MSAENKTGIGTKIVIGIFLVFSCISAVTSVYQWRIERIGINATEVQLGVIRMAFQEHFDKTGDYPPFKGDNCSACDESQRKSWLAVSGILDNLTDGTSIEKDAWGRYFAYDKNYQLPAWHSWSVLCSTGKNGVLETSLIQDTGTTGGDDVCIFFPDND
jgi:hypothetical protein